ncbi:MAG: hypothetical protein WDN47_00845 [Candidatus Doudnabacteria bacterium]
MNWKDYIKTHQHIIVLSVGYVLVGVLAFGLGRFSSPKSPVQPSVSQVHIEQAASIPDNYNPNEPSIQSASTKTVAAPNSSGSLNCTGKIKGSSSMIYHMPGGAFYNKTTHPIRCFTTEAEAKAAGFRKSSR